MPENTINKQTLISVGVTISIVAGAFFVGSVISNIQTRTTNVEKKIEVIQGDYVPRQEYEAAVLNINKNLDAIRKILEK